MSLARAQAAPGPEGAPVDVEIVIPTYNEERVLTSSILRLHRFLADAFPFSWRIVIADNASVDGTAAVAASLSERLERVELLRIPTKGRGRALRAAWSASDARAVCYMDVDLSTDLRGLLPLIAPLLSGHSDLAIGTRLARGAHVERGPKRELISRSYNRLLHLALRARFSDAQCGFKAVRRDAVEQLLPDVRDDQWFFDTELLVLAQRRGLRIHEVPVDWVDDPDSRVDITSTALADLRGVARLLLEVPLVTFLLIGVASTLAYALLFLALVGALGAGGSSTTALAITAAANTAANRRFTFRRRGRAERTRQYTAALIVFLIALGLTDGALAVLRDLDPFPGRLLELVVLVAATLVTTVCRYAALRAWVFRPSPDSRSLGGRRAPGAPAG